MIGNSRDASRTHSSCRGANLTLTRRLEPVRAPKPTVSHHGIRTSSRKDSGTTLKSQWFVRTSRTCTNSGSKTDGSSSSGCSNPASMTDT